MTRDEQVRKLKDKAQHFMNVFNSDSGQIVLDDLKKFCRYNTSLFHESPLRLAMNEGQRNVLLYILKKLETQL